MTTPTKAQINSFVAFSAAMTGLPASLLAPSLDTTDLKTAYCTVMFTNNPTLGPNVLSAWDQANSQGVPTDSIVRAALQIPPYDPAFGPDDFAALVGGGATTAQITAILQAVMQVWLSGSWIQSPGDSSPVTTVVSANAYVGGFMWQIAQAHPMGYSTDIFGYWADPPPSSSLVNAPVSKG